MIPMCNILLPHRKKPKKSELFLLSLCYSILRPPASQSHYNIELLFISVVVSSLSLSVRYRRLTSTHTVDFSRVIVFNIIPSLASKQQVYSCIAMMNSLRQLVCTRRGFSADFPSLTHSLLPISLHRAAEYISWRFIHSSGRSIHSRHSSCAREK